MPNKVATYSVFNESTGLTDTPPYYLHLCAHLYTALIRSKGTTFNVAQKGVGGVYWARSDPNARAHKSTATNGFLISQLLDNNFYTNKLLV